MVLICRAHVLFIRLTIRQLPGVSKPSLLQTILQEHSHSHMFLWGAGQESLWAQHPEVLGVGVRGGGPHSVSLSTSKLLPGKLTPANSPTSVSVSLHLWQNLLSPNFLTPANLVYGPYLHLNQNFCNVSFPAPSVSSLEMPGGAVLTSSGKGCEG